MSTVRAQLTTAYAAALLGTGRVLVPFALIAVGYVLVRGRPREEPVRVVIGSGFLAVAATGLLHLRSGGPACWEATYPTAAASTSLKFKARR